MVPGEEALDASELAHFRKGVQELAPFILLRLSADRAADELQVRDAALLRRFTDAFTPVRDLHVGCRLDGRALTELEERPAFVDTRTDTSAIRAFVIWDESGWPPLDKGAEALATALAYALGTSHFEAFLALINAPNDSACRRLLRLAGAPSDVLALAGWFMGHHREAALKLENVRKVYRSGEAEIVAVDRASLEVGPAEIVALVGPSGSGKTTLLSISGGLLSPSEGRVVVAGDDISGYDPKRLTRFRRENVGFVFQSVNLVPFLTARENLLVVGDFSRRDKKKSKARADQLLAELGLEERADNLPHQLSGGERQRVAVGRAFMNQPDLVLIDEPTSALDTKLGEQVMELIVTEVRARDTAAVVVTHDMRMTHYADRTLNIVDGILGDAATS